MSTNDLSWTKFPKELRGPTFDLFQRELAKYNARQLMPAFSNEDWREKVDDYACVSAAEGEGYRGGTLRGRSLVKDVPSEVDDFIEWFEELKCVGPGQGAHRSPGLRIEQSLEYMLWFLTQEVAARRGLMTSWR